MKFIYGFIIAAFFVASSTQSTPVRKCSEGALPKEVRIEGCSKAPCLLYRGTDTTAEWDFVVPEATEHLKPRVRARVAGITTNYPLPQQNACESLKNAECPLKAGQEVTYKLTMPILKQYPKIPVNIEFAFIDDNQKVATCFQVDAKVTDK